MTIKQKLKRRQKYHKEQASICAKGGFRMEAILHEGNYLVVTKELNKINKDGQQKVSK